MSDNDRKVNVIITLVVSVVVILIVVKAWKFFVPTYNELVNLQENANQAESNVKNMMQRRIELIPDLVAIVEEETKHSDKALKDINDTAGELKDILESANTTDEMSAVNKEASKQMDKLLEIARENFTVKDSYSRLSAQVEGSVTRVALARQRYNSEATKYNAAIREIPNCIVAKMLGFKPMNLFEADKEANKTRVIEWDD